MRDILHPSHRGVLERFIGVESPRPVLLAFDYDGVLAPLVRDPAGRGMRRSTRDLLARLARRAPVAAVSGRSWAHTRQLTEGVVPYVVGNHGFELLHARRVPAAVLRQVRGWRRHMEAALAGVPGIHFEDKRSTLAVHYGLSRSWRRGEQAAYAAANQLTGTRLVAGKKVLNILPRKFPNKGDALRALLSRLGLVSALYLGDDVTDEDAFAVGEPLVLGVRVGPGRSLAPWRLESQDRVDELLRRLLSLVGDRPGRRGRR